MKTKSHSRPRKTFHHCSTKEDIVTDPKTEDHYKPTDFLLKWTKYLKKKKKL